MKEYMSYIDKAGQEDEIVVDEKKQQAVDGDEDWVDDHQIVSNLESNRRLLNSQPETVMPNGVVMQDYGQSNYSKSTRQGNGTITTGR